MHRVTHKHSYAAFGSRLCFLFQTRSTLSVGPLRIALAKWSDRLGASCLKMKAQPASETSCFSVNVCATRWAKSCLNGIHHHQNLGLYEEVLTSVPKCMYLCCNGCREIRKWMCWHVGCSNLLFKSYLAIIFWELKWEDKNFNTMRVEERSFISSSHFLLCSYFQGRIIGGHVKENKVSMGHNWTA